MAAPCLNFVGPVTGASKEQHQLENKLKIKSKQDKQVPTDYWSSHRGQLSIPTPKQEQNIFSKNMCPTRLELHHLAAEELLKYAVGMCTISTGKLWTLKEMEAGIGRIPHVSVLVPSSMYQLASEIECNVRQGQAKVLLWNDIKVNLPKYLKVSPIVMITHKSRLFREILDLLFVIRLANGHKVPAVNESSVNTAPDGAIYQLGHSLMIIIHAFAQANEEEKIFMKKWDIKDGFWQLKFQEGEKLIFAMFYPRRRGGGVKWVVPKCYF